MPLKNWKSAALASLAVLGFAQSACGQCEPIWKPEPSGGGPDSLVQALTVTASGDLLVGGNFDNVNGVWAHRTARRISATGAWEPLGGYLGWETSITALAETATGRIFAGGYFIPGFWCTPHIAEWNGASWHRVGAGGPNGRVIGIGTLPGGEIIIGGAFGTVDGVERQRIARWNGSGWSGFGTGLNGIVSCVALSGETLFAGGSFTAAGGVPAAFIARWDGATWSPLASGMNAQVYTLLVHSGGDLVAGGVFTAAGGIPAQRVARWDGTAWTAMGAGMDGYVHGLTEFRNGDIAAVGAFTTAGDAPARRVARWDGYSWHPLGMGLNDTAYVAVVLPTGDLAVGGRMTMAGGAPAPYFAIWGVPSGCRACDSVDFNNDGSSFDPTDIDAFFSVFSEGPCVPELAACNDLDFNNDGAWFDPCDVDSFLLAFSEGPCTPCGS